MRERIQDSNRGIREIQDDQYLHAFTQRLLGRVMFLYFLQRKGWLAGDPRFLTTWWERLRRDGQPGWSYYGEFLEPLSFDTLNRRRPDDRSPWGPIPYLNGGLFEKEYDWPVLHLPNALFDPKELETGILGVFNSFNFTVERNTPLDVDVAIDPEMLGKVFENMLEAEERGRTGTFYTPRAVVQWMCREALTAHLADAASIEPGTIRGLFDEPERPELTVEQARTLERAVMATRVLDPAVGSGAFPLGMLDCMMQVRRACFRALGGAAAPGSALQAGWKREIIENCLFGVDIKPEAIEIARLRSWLSLVVELEGVDQAEPLPNLDYKLMDGNSLVETLDGEPILGRGGTVDVVRSWLEDGTAYAAVQRIRELRNEFFDAEPAKRKALGKKIHDAEVAVLESHVKQRLARLDDEMADCDRLIQAAAAPPARTVAKLARLSNQRLELTNLLRRFRDEGVLPFFLFGLHFGDVFADKGGFDIVIANPPYAGKEKINKLSYVAELHRQSGKRENLYAYFMERALGFGSARCQALTRPGGVVCYITSRTWSAQQGYLCEREALLAQQLLVVYDLPPVFDATVDTAIILARRSEARPDHELEFIGASRLDQQIRRKAGLRGAALSAEVQRRIEALETESAALEYDHTTRRGVRVVAHSSDGGIPFYRVPMRLYQEAIFGAVFEPRWPVLRFYDDYMADWVAAVNREFTVDAGGRTTSVTLWDMVSSSDKIEKYRDVLESYRNSLKPGDLTILGAVTEGGQGLATADNGRFLAYLEGTPAAANLLAKNEALSPDATGAYPNSDWGENGVRRIIRGEQVAPERYWTPEYARKGIPEPVAHWVPYQQGDPEGNRWCRINACYIDWSEKSVRWLYEHSGRKGHRMPVVRNPQFYFREGFCWNNIVNRRAGIKARRINPCVPSHVSMFLVPTTPAAPAELAVALLNSQLVELSCRRFNYSPQHVEVSHARLLPVRIPDSSTGRRVAAGVRSAVDLQGRRLEAKAKAELKGDARAAARVEELGDRLAEAERDIDKLVWQWYGYSEPLVTEDEQHPDEDEDGNDDTDEEGDEE